MAIDLKNLNHNQLKELISKAQQRQDDLRKEKAAKLRDKIEAMIKAEGFTLEDVYPRLGRRTRRTGTVKPKYRNPENPAMTWSGRGKRPRWFSAALAAGKKERDLLIK
ncbi:DNA-binding protein H-NS [Mizugakiibacter sediminis]|uniref:DNA-binding protein H-NS n=1 Tax=Mizugakiibacter sediminis TaxID=1475481 RepID=A0A0K8QKX0_9GAMM|nr:H-NS histone family protein [Mizugakiibacter sediminis]GAP65127.1 DNA-binding protein H-NS [Mizugakiibacter sediminis]